MIRKISFASPIFALSLTTFALMSFGSSASAQDPSFTRHTLQGAVLDGPTTLQVGPDGRLYVGERYGFIRVYEVMRTQEGDYVVTSEEVISEIQALSNRHDTGYVQQIFGRQLTGLLVVGTATHPVLYVTSSDPRVAVGFDSGLDTNSGILTRLTWNGSSWDQLDLVRGLPRCEENHGPNGMALDEERGILYMAQGGNTNMGAPSSKFGFLPEYALSAAILTIDLNAIGEQTYDLPTLDDPSRPNTGPNGEDEHDPFGGNNAANQAIIVPDGPVQVYAPGFRNAYDICIHSSGRLYTVDNGSNYGWGGPPVDCTNAPNENDTASHNDGLHMIGMLGDGGGYYGGFPNPFRGNSSNTINGQSPIPPGTENPIECDYLIPGIENGALTSWISSTNGIAEYTASNFGGDLQGSLICALYNDSSLVRVDFDAQGNFVGTSTLFSNVGAQTLDLCCQGDNDYFSGTIWACNLNHDTVVVFEPQDDLPCFGSYDIGLDEDSDGYSNADEIDNGTNPCSAADIPADFDGDFLSDLNDPDDDGDGINDVNDAFARDASNGQSTLLPIDYGWAVGDPGTGLFGLGFTGLMANGSEDYLNQFAPGDLTPGGAAGKFTIDRTTSGTSFGALNDQDNAFQLGVPISVATEPFELSTRVEGPYFNGVPAPGQSFGLFVGDGTQDEYVKIVVAANGGVGGIRVIYETAGAVIHDVMHVVDVLNTSSVDLILKVDTSAAHIQPMHRLDGGTLEALGAPIPLQGHLLREIHSLRAIAIGIISTHGVSGTPYAATWDGISLFADPPLDCGRHAEFGTGFPGTNGVPRFYADAPPAIGSNVNVTLENSSGADSLGFMLLGLTQAEQQSTLGGVLLTIPLTVTGVFVPAAGLVIPASIPDDPSLVNIPIYLQAVQDDPGASNGMSFSNGLMLKFGDC